MRRGVFAKLMVAFLVVIAAATITLDFTVRRAWEQSLRNEIQRTLIEKTRLFASRVEAEPNASLPQMTHAVAAAGNVRATIIDASGHVLADSQADAETMENHATRPEFIAALHGQIGSSERWSHTIGVPFLYVAAPIQYLSQSAATNGPAAVRMAYPLSSIEQTTAKIRQSLLVGSGIALIAALILATIISQLVTRRLRRIVNFTERIAAGDLSARIAQDSTDEIATVATALDATARKLEESFSAMETSRQELETLLNSMQEAVIAIGGDGKVLWVNGRMKRLMGANLRIGSPVVQTGRDPNFLAAMEGAKSSRQLTVTRATSLVPGRIFQVTAAPMPPAGAVAVLHDLTEMERVEKTRRDFIANVSHELRTPLTSIQGYAETLLDSRVAEDKGTREFLEIILKNTARMSRLTEDLLALARVESGEHRFDRRPISAADVLKDATESFALLAAEHNMELSIQESVAEAIYADPEAMHQVMSNLIHNAMNYASEGKVIAIGARSSGTTVEFYVRDQGRGIASEHVPRLFERFYRVDKDRSRESGGTGLGLAIVKHIVLAHGGEVRAESRVGHGSTFYFNIPIPASSQGTEAAPLSQSLGQD